jgi:hypothetical protein
VRTGLKVALRAFAESGSVARAVRKRSGSTISKGRLRGDLRLSGLGSGPDSGECASEDAAPFVPKISIRAITGAQRQHQYQSAELLGKSGRVNVSPQDQRKITAVFDRGSGCRVPGNGTHNSNSVTIAVKKDIEGLSGNLVTESDTKMKEEVLAACD